MNAASDASVHKTKKKISPEKLLVHVRAVLPLLVAHAISKQPITYKEISEQTPSKPARNANVSFGAIGRALEMLSSKELFREEGAIPNLASIVQQTGKSSSGRGVYLVAPKEALATEQTREEWLREQRAAVKAYRRWPEVLASLGLQSLPNLEPSLQAAREGGTGEDEAHRALKKFVCAHPESVGFEKTLIGTTELMLHSMDRIDVSFVSDEVWACAEVKPITSQEGDIVRGVFQVIKYRALLRATLLMRGELKPVECVLALGGNASEPIRTLARRLNVRLCDGLDEVVRAHRGD